MLGKVGLNAVLHAGAKGRVGEDDVHAVGVGVAHVGAGQGVVVAHKAGIFHAVQQHVGNAQHVGQLL